MHFLTDIVGKGFFVRADAGPARFVLDIDGAGPFSGQTASDWGFGGLVGAGFGLPVGQGTRILLNGNGVVQSTETEITGREKKKLFPTDIGIVVNDFLVENFAKVLDYNFTASVEQDFDEIAEGGKEWSKMIDAFYKPFHENVEDTLENSERATGQ